MRDVDGESAPVTIGIVAGEASGDALAATLIHAVRSRRPWVRFAGIAGPKMEAAGCEAWASTEDLAVRGFAEVVAHLPRLIALRRDIARRFRAARVPVFVGVDAPDFNLGLERKLKRRRVRTVHFVSPSVWAWRRERLQSMGRAVDRMLALFPFEPPLYEAVGIPVTYVGHPLAQEARAAGTRRAAREILKQSVAAPLFALLPGSRLSEIEMHATIVLDAAAAITEGRPDARFVVPLVSRRTRDAFVDAQHRGGHDALPLTLLYGHASDALRAADVALVASGTATLEAALAGCPHVIFYRVERGDGAHRRAQAAAAVGGAAQRARRSLRRAGALAGTRDSAQSCAGGAEPVRRPDHPAAHRDAVCGDERGAGQGYGWTCSRRRAGRAGPCARRRVQRRSRAA